MGETVTILCVDDRDDGETFDLQFERDRASRCQFDGDDPRALARFGHVVQSEREARTVLLRAANAASAPDIVLIDNMLRGVGRERYVEDGLKLMAWIRDEFARRKDLGMPACMLWTARPTPGLGFAFVRCGGVQVIDRQLVWPDQLDAIWQGYDWHAGGEGGWSHAAQGGHPDLKLPPSCVALLPYLADDVPVPDIAAALGIKDDDVHDRRRALVKKINEQIPERLLPGGRALLGNGRSTSLARIAQDHGHVWVPLAYRKYLDDASG